MQNKYFWPALVIIVLSGTIYVVNREWSEDRRLLPAPNNGSSPVDSAPPIPGADAVVRHEAERVSADDALAESATQQERTAELQTSRPKHSSTARRALRLLEAEGIATPDLSELNPTQIADLTTAYNGFRGEIEQLHGKRLLEIQTLTEKRFEDGEFERYTFNPQEREAGKEYAWDKQRPVGHTLRRLEFDDATGMGIAKIVHVLPGDYAEIDQLDLEEEELERARRERFLEIIHR
jgi:hypothetical protein